jgi:membrane-associated protease RseP (regulator of RpoE activity)
MVHRFLFCTFLFSLVVCLASKAQPEESGKDHIDQSFDWSYSSDEGGGGSSYLGVDIDDVSAERLAELKLKEEHGAEITMVDQDAPAGKAGLREHDVIVSLNGTPIESTAQLRRMIKETPPGRVVTLGISRDGQPMTVKVQLADRHKAMDWSPKVKVEIPRLPDMPAMPDFDMPVSVIISHQSMRSGLIVENITQQLGEFFGVKGANGVLVRSVEKGSSGEKAGFRAGDVITKVDDQPVHDSSDFTHALRSSSGKSASITVMRDRHEQNLTLTLPAKRDSGSLQEDSFEVPEINAETQQAINRVGEEMARLSPAINEKLDVDDSSIEELQERLQERQDEIQDQMQEWQSELQRRLEEERQQLQDRKLELDERKKELEAQSQRRQEELNERWREIANERKEQQKELEQRKHELRDRQREWERQVDLRRDLSKTWAEI